MSLAVLSAFKPRARALLLAIAVLAAGALAPAAAFAQAATIGQWDAARKWPAVAVHLVMLHTGKVLFFRGDETVPKTYVWDPATEAIQGILPETDNLFCA